MDATLGYWKNLGVFTCTLTPGKFRLLNPASVAAS